MRLQRKKYPLALYPSKRKTGTILIFRNKKLIFITIVSLKKSEILYLFGKSLCAEITIEQGIKSQSLLPYQNFAVFQEGCRSITFSRKNYQQRGIIPVK